MTRVSPSLQPDNSNFIDTTVHKLRERFVNPCKWIQRQNIRLDKEYPFVCKGTGVSGPLSNWRQVAHMYLCVDIVS